MARQHPGQTPGSFMMEGIMDFLTDPDSQEADFLRQSFIFKLIPMLNPDGVIHGNYRCSLAGVDLNRMWDNPKQDYHETIYWTQKLIYKAMEEQEIRYIIDLHGHSRKMNSFFYGNPNIEYANENQIFPLIASTINPSISYEDSQFYLSSDQDSTARQTLFQEIENQYIYTFQASFYGALYFDPQTGQYQKRHFSISDFKRLGIDLCRAIYKIAFAEEEILSESQFKPGAIERPTLNKILQKLKLEDNQLQQENLNSDGSDSDPGADELSQKELQSLEKEKKTKKAPKQDPFTVLTQPNFYSHVKCNCHQRERNAHNSPTTCIYDPKSLDVKNCPNFRESLVKKNSGQITRFTQTEQVDYFENIGQEDRFQFDDLEFVFQEKISGQDELGENEREKFSPASTPLRQNGGKYGFLVTDSPMKNTQSELQTRQQSSSVNRHQIKKMISFYVQKNSDVSTNEKSSNSIQANKFKLKIKSPDASANEIEKPIDEEECLDNLISNVDLDSPVVKNRIIIPKFEDKAKEFYLIDIDLFFDNEINRVNKDLEPNTNLEKSIKFLGNSVQSNPIVQSSLANSTNLSHLIQISKNNLQITGVQFNDKKLSSSFQKKYPFPKAKYRGTVFYIENSTQTYYTYNLQLNYEDCPQNTTSSDNFQSQEGDFNINNSSSILNDNKFSNNCIHQNSNRLPLTAGSNLLNSQSPKQIFDSLFDSIKIKQIKPLQQMGSSRFSEIKSNIYSNQSSNNGNNSTYMEENQLVVGRQVFINNGNYANSNCGSFNIGGANGKMSLKQQLIKMNEQKSGEFRVHAPTQLFNNLYVSNVSAFGLAPGKIQKNSKTPETGTRSRFISEQKYSQRNNQENQSNKNIRSPGKQETLLLQSSNNNNLIDIKSNYVSPKFSNSKDLNNENTNHFSLVNNNPNNTNNLRMYFSEEKQQKLMHMRKGFYNDPLELIDQSNQNLNERQSEQHLQQQEVYANQKPSNPTQNSFQQQIYDSSNLNYSYRQKAEDNKKKIDQNQKNGIYQIQNRSFYVSEDKDSQKEQKFANTSYNNSKSGQQDKQEEINGLDINQFHIYNAAQININIINNNFPVNNSLVNTTNLNNQNQKIKQEGGEGTAGPENKKIQNNQYNNSRKDNRQMIKDQIEQFTDQMLQIINFGAKQNVPNPDSNFKSQPKYISSENYNFSKSSNSRTEAQTSNNNNNLKTFLANNEFQIHQKDITIQPRTVQIKVRNQSANGTFNQEDITRRVVFSTKQQVPQSVSKYNDNEKHGNKVAPEGEVKSIENSRAVAGGGGNDSNIYRIKTRAKSKPRQISITPNQLRSGEMESEVKPTRLTNQINGKLR